MANPSNKFKFTEMEPVGNHKKYKNVFFKLPPPQAVLSKNSNCFQITKNGVTDWYYMKSQQYIIDPNWSKQKLKDEMSFALSKMDLDEEPTILNNYTMTYDSYFTDGTKLKIIFRHFQKDPVNQIDVYHHLSLMTIK